MPGFGPALGIAWQNSSGQLDTSGSCEQALPKIGAIVGDSTDGPELDYDVKFTRTGVFYAWVRMLGGNANSDSIHVSLDDAPPVTYGGQGIGANSNVWIWKGDVAGVTAPDGGFSPVKVDIGAPGYHTLKVYMREDGVAIDKIVVSTNSATPSGMGPPESARE